MARLSSTDPVGFKLTGDGDLDLTGGRATLVAGAEGFVQGLKARLELARGQLYWNRRAGVPWIENDWVAPREAIMGQPYAHEKLRRAVTEQFLRTPGAFRLERFASSFAGVTRSARVVARGKIMFSDLGPTDTGEIVQGGV
jgi:hypothetical protein